MLKNIRHILSSVAEANAIRINGLNRRILLPNSFSTALQHRTKKTKPATLSSLFKPVEVKQSTEELNIGMELTGLEVSKTDIVKILNRFTQRREIRMLCLENGLDSE